MKDKLIVFLRWVGVLPLSILGSYLVYIVFFWLNRANEFPRTNVDSIWDYAVMFLSHGLMGGAFIGIGLYIAPSHHKVCACVLFAIVCIFAGLALFANIATGFSWVSLISVICLVIGAGYVFYLSLNE